MGVIYLRKNLINGMMYVGQTINFKKRERCWQQIGYRYGNQRLTDDRNTYGLDNFETVILKEVDDSELDRWERHFIKILNTIYPNGYNINEGGVSGFNCSDETKKKISESNSGENNGMYGKMPWNKNKKWSDDVKEKLSKSHVGKPSPMKGKHHTDETKKKISKNKKHVPNTKLAKPLVQIKPNGEIIEWSSVKECKDNGYWGVDRVCRGERPKAYECEWMYKSDYERMQELNLVLN